jgi:hypothetical protein
MAGKMTVAQLAEQVAQLTELLANAQQGSQATPSEARTNARQQAPEARGPVVKLATGAQCFVAIASKGGADKAAKPYGDGPRVRFNRVNSRGSAYAEATLRRDTLEAIWGMPEKDRKALTKALEDAVPAHEALVAQQVS